MIENKCLKKLIMEYLLEDSQENKDKLEKI